MKKDIIDDCSVVIRSVGERTEEACKDKLKEVFPEENITVISDRPFSATLRKSLEHGLDKGLPWTFCVDADVLIDRIGVQELFNRARVERDHVFEMHGFVFDKFFNEVRPAGNHLYRTSHIPWAIQAIPQEGDSLRPETTMIKALVSKGLSNRYFEDLIVGIHDFEQYYLDIYCKGYLHAHKHATHVSRLLPFWKNQAETDVDFQVLLWGVAAGVASTGSIFVDKNKVPLDIFHLYGKNLSEKEQIRPGQPLTLDMSSVLNAGETNLRANKTKMVGLRRLLRGVVRYFVRL